MSFGCPEVSMTPKANIIYLLRHQDTSRHSRKNEHFLKPLFGNLEILEIKMNSLETMGTDPKDPSIYF